MYKTGDNYILKNIVCITMLICGISNIKPILQYSVLHISHNLWNINYYVKIAVVLHHHKVERYHEEDKSDHKNSGTEDCLFSKAPLQI